MKRYLVSTAINATPVHAGFVASVTHYPGEFIVIQGRYRNPTSIWTDSDRGDQWYAEEVLPYLLNDKRQLCNNLVIYGNIKIRPTAKRPLTGWEVTVGKNSAILGHTKHAFRTVATASRTPRLLLTTGACTVANYTDSNAGQHGVAHHIIGAVVVEVEDDGTYFVRQINAERDGSFIDLDKRYTPDGVETAPPALVLTMGDIHVGQEEPAVLEATKQLAKLISPKFLVLHDVLDFRSRNHHDNKSIKKAHNKFVEGTDSVEKEVFNAANAIRVLSQWAKQTRIVRSNHDAAFDRWLEEMNPHLDAANAEYYFGVWHRLFEEKKRTGTWVDAFELEARRLGVPENVQFLGRNDDFTVRDVNYTFHGDIGIGGARGSSGQFAKLGVKTVTAHSHAPVVEDGNFTAGVTAKLDQDYNNIPSNWMHAHVVQYANGKRTLVGIVAGKFRGT